MGQLVPSKAAIAGEFVAEVVGLAVATKRVVGAIAASAHHFGQFADRLFADVAAEDQGPLETEDQGVDGVVGV